MKTRKFIILIAVLNLAVINANGQDKSDTTKPVKIIFEPYIPVSDDTINWNPARPLTIDDFAAIPLDVQQSFASLSTKGIIVRGRFSEGADTNAFFITSGTVFIKHASWVIKAVSTAKSRAARILSVEQLQLDIAKLYEEKMKRYLRTRHFTIENFNRELNKTYLDYRQQSADEMARMKNDCMLVDGANKKERDKNLAEWQSKIATELKAMLDNPL